MNLPMLAALAELDPTDREILVDYAVLGRHMHAIAADVGITTSHASQRRQRAERQMRELVVRAPGPKVPIANGALDGNCAGCGHHFDTPKPGCRTCVGREYARLQRSAA